MPFSIGYDDGVPVNFLGRDGFKQCGSSSFVIVSGDGRYADVYSKRGEAIARIDTGHIFNGIAEVVKLDVVCALRDDMRIGFVAYSDRAHTSPYPESTYRSVAVYDLRLDKWSPFFTMGQLASSENSLYVIGPYETIYGLDGSLTPRVLGRINSPFTEDIVRPLSEVATLAGERIHVHVGDDDMVCVIGTMIGCASLRPLLRELHIADHDVVEFGPTLGSTSYFFKSFGAFACDLIRGSCQERMRCDCPHQDVRYATTLDGGILQLRTDEGRLEVRNDTGDVIFEGGQELLRITRFATIVTLGNEPFLLSNTEDGGHPELRVISLNGAGVQ